MDQYEVLSSIDDLYPGYLDTKVDNETIAIVDDKLTVIGGVGGDHKVMATPTDQTPGFLDAKVDGATIEVSGNNLQVTSNVALVSDVQADTFNFAGDDGTSNSYIANISPVPDNLTYGMCVSFPAGNSNTGPCTLTVPAQGAPPFSSATVSSGGIGYIPGDILGVTQSGAQNGSVMVTGVTGGGISGLSINNGGSG
jgi:hypothetical protein